MGRQDRNRCLVTTDGVLAARPSRGESHRFALTLVYGKDPRRFGERLLLTSEHLPLDRATSVFPGGLLDDTQISRRHAEIRWCPDFGYEVMDLGSRNGTYVNGQRISIGRPTLLRPGDVIQIGSTILLFHTCAGTRPRDAPEVIWIDGRSDAARTLRSTIAKVARHPFPVLIQGETGVGKEMVATALAHLGRPSGPYVAVNAAATPASLMESILFGHEKGAFTDAKERRQGLYQQADKGTLFLDEVGDLPLETQVKLLRVLEEGAVLPLGARQPIAVDVRVVSATNKVLLEEVQRGRFRGDLYARLSTGVITVPPLRERREDIPTLALKFSRGRMFEPETITRLLLHPWPFNVRELRSIVQQILMDSDPTGPLALTSSVEQTLVLHSSLLARDATVRHRGGPETNLDRKAIEEVLRRHGGNVTLAAREVGKDRAQFYRILKKFGLKPDDFRLPSV